MVKKLLTERISEMMIRCSLATGHGDVVEDLLEELEAQIKELQKDRRLDGAEILRLRAVADDRFERAEKAEVELAQARNAALEEAAAAILEIYSEYTWRHQVAADIRAQKGEPK